MPVKHVLIAVASHEKGYVLPGNWPRHDVSTQGPHGTYGRWLLRQWIHPQRSMPSIRQEFQMTECEATGPRSKGIKIASLFLLITIASYWPSLSLSNLSFFFDTERWRSSEVEKVSLGAEDSSFNKWSLIAYSVLRVWPVMCLCSQGTLNTVVGREMGKGKCGRVWPSREGWESWGNIREGLLTQTWG